LSCCQFTGFGQNCRQRSNAWRGYSVLRLRQKNGAKRLLAKVLFFI